VSLRFEVSPPQNSGECCIIFHRSGGRVTAPLKFCIVDAVQFVSPVGHWMRRRWSSVVDHPGYPNTRHVHKVVYVGILSALTRMDKKVKTGWTEAMSGPQGEKVLEKPFANKA